MADILLVNPRFMSDLRQDRQSDETDIFPPLGLLYLGAVLEQAGFDVEIYDSRVMPTARDRLILRDKIQHTRICVGISVMTSQIGHALWVSKLVKELNPEVFVVWGGVHPSLYPEQTLRNPLVDFIVLGEGERPMFELASAFKRSCSFERIHSLGYKTPEGLKINRNPVLPDVNSLPFPAWHLVDVSRYLYRTPSFASKPTRMLAIVSSRGCPHRCTFCLNPLIPSRRKWRAMKPERVIDEIEFLKTKYGIEHIWFADENFFINQRRVNKICDLLIDSGLDVSWFANIRADYFCRDGAVDLLRKAREAGFSECGIGAESGSDRVLTLLKKDITTAQTLTSAKLCNELDIVPIYSFMSGLPFEIKEELLQTVELIRRIRKVCPNSRIIGPQIFRPYPGGELYETCKTLGMKEPDDLWEWVTSETCLAENDEYFSAKMLPWVNDPNFLYAISLYGNALGISIDQALKEGNFKQAIFAAVAKLRVRFRIYGLPYEKALWVKICQLAKRSQSDILLEIKRITGTGCKGLENDRSR